MKIKLQDAADVINTVKRRAQDPPLVLIVACADCGDDFAMPPHVVSKLDLHKEDKVCRACAADRRRQAARVPVKSNGK